MMMLKHQSEALHDFGGCGSDVVKVKSSDCVCGERGRMILDAIYIVQVFWEQRNKSVDVGGMGCGLGLRKEVWVKEGIWASKTSIENMSHQFFGDSHRVIIRIEVL